MENRQLLAQTMACLLCTTPETTLGKLLNFCLAAKVEATNSHKTPLAFAEELLDHPEKLSNWISDIIDSDDDYSTDKMVAVSEMRLKNPQKFMELLFEELQAVRINEPE
ncbi:hypothetical protein [Myxosarcina sp. GI1(2024)]